MMKLFYIREMLVRPLEESLDRIVSAPNPDMAVTLWQEATGITEMPYMVDELPEPSKMGVMDWKTMQLIERL